MSPKKTLNPSQPSGRWRREILPAAVIVAITLLSYLPALRNGFIWDDNDYVTNNPVLSASDGLHRMWFERTSTPQYYPLVFTTFRIEHSLWNYNPAGYHAVNILLHAANALLLWRVLVFLGVPGGWLAALIFAVHPVHVESVAWVTERKNVLSGFFYLAALGVALKYYLGQDSASRRRVAYGAALALFACALLSKTVTVTLPVAIALILWWKRGRISKDEAVTLLPFFVIGAALALNTAWLEKTHVRALGEEWNLSIVQRGLIAGRALWFYLSKLAWPNPLIFVYPRWNVDAAVAWQYLFPAAALAALAALWFFRGRIGRGPFAATAFFGISLAPALGFFNYYPMRFSFVADHFQYLASIGLIVLAVAVATTRAPAMPTLAKVIAGALVLAFAVLTFRQTLIYRDAETLWGDTLAKNPKAWIAHENLGNLLMAKMEMPRADQASLVAEAMSHYDQSVALAPRSAIMWFNRGLAYAKTGRLEAAQRDLDQAIALKPDYSEAFVNRGLLFGINHRFDDAIRDFDQAIAFQPNSAVAWFNRGDVYARMDHLDAALRDYSQAIALDPRYSVAYVNRSILYYMKKDYPRALADLRAVERLGGHPPPDLVRDVTEAAGRSAAPPSRAP